MYGIFGAVLATVVAFGVVPATAAPLTMLGGKLAKLKDKSGTASDQVLLKFKPVGVFITSPPPSPVCPATSTLKLKTDMGERLITLDCAFWAPTPKGYLYADSAGSSGGVQKIAITATPELGKLLIKVRGDQYGVAALSGPIEFLEVELAIDTTSYCSRFASPPSTFTKNEIENVKIKGPSTACLAPTPTVTDTPVNTPTPTVTSTRTQTSTRTHTPTATPSFTVPPGSTSTATGTATATPTVTATLGTAEAFRIDSLALRDPHIFVELLGDCMDGTDPPGILNFFSANGEVEDLLNEDGDMDGSLDLNLLTVFRPLLQPPTAGGMVQVVTGECTPPVGSEVCGPDMNPPYLTPYANQAAGICLAPIAGTTGPDNIGFYTPGITSAGAPCLGTVPVSISFPFGLFTVPLQDVRAGATYDDDPADNLLSGILSGFLSETDADNITLPLTLLVVGGRPVSSLLPGGQDACPEHTAMDTGPNDQPGWYFYLNFTAHRVTWTGP